MSGAAYHWADGAEGQHILGTAAMADVHRLLGNAVAMIRSERSRLEACLVLQRVATQMATGEVGALADQLKEMERTNDELRDQSDGFHDVAAAGVDR